MIPFLAGVAAAFGGLVLVKGAIEPIARQVFRQGIDRLLRALPRIYDLLDPVWPAMEETLCPEELEQVVRETFAAMTGEDWSRASMKVQTQAIDEFFARRDSRIAAAKRAAHTTDIDP